MKRKRDKPTVEEELKSFSAVAVWECRIVGFNVTLPQGADVPLRQAVEKAFRKLTGDDSVACFSSWDAELPAIEARIVLEDVADRSARRTPTS